MSKEERLLKAFGEVDEKFIEEAAPTQNLEDNNLVENNANNIIAKAKSRRSAKMWIGMVASIMVIAGVGVALWQAGVFNFDKGMLKNEDSVYDTRWPQKFVYVEESPADKDEMALIPKWEDMSISRKFGEFSFEDIRYTTRVAGIKDENIGKKLGTATLEGYDVYEDKAYTIQAEVFEINNISIKCATAIKFADDNEYYVYVNSWYRPEDLGQLISDLNLKETVKFGKIHYNYIIGDKQHNIEYEDINDKLVWDMLLADTSLSNVHDDRDMHISSMGVSVDIPLLGYENISLSLTEDGYLTTNILDSGKCFYIGKEKVKEFISYVLDNLEGFEIIYVYDDKMGNDNNDMVPEVETEMPIETETQIETTKEEAGVIEETTSTASGFGSSIN